MVYYLNPVRAGLDHVQIIINKCDNFIRLAGLIQLPMKTVNEITEFIISEYAKFVIGKYKFSNELSSYIRSFIENTNINNNIFIVPLKELPYFNNINKELENKLNKLSVVITTDKKNSGKFIFGEQKIEISFNNIKPSSMGQFSDQINEIKRTIAHELTHYIQHCINEFVYFTKGKDIGGGLPPKKYRNPELWYSQSLYEERIKDIEFYSYLKDKVELLKRLINIRPIYYKNKEEIFRAFVGLPNNFYENVVKDLSSWKFSDKDKRLILNFAKMAKFKPDYYFKTLKENNSPKYGLAVKLLYN